MVATRAFYLCWITSILGVSIAFQPQNAHLPTRKDSMRNGAAIFNCASDVEEYLAANYPLCSALFAKNADVMKKIIKSDVGFTIFAPNSEAFSRLGEKKISQLNDVRNAEVIYLIDVTYVVTPMISDQPLISIHIGFTVLL